MKKIALVIVFLALVCPSKSYALKEDTHAAINEAIAQRVINGFSLDEYLIEQLGIAQGKNEKLAALDADNRTTTKRIYEWLGYGGAQEDRPGSWLDYASSKPSRSTNHFHNPLRSWDEAGLDDTVFGRHYTGQSQVLWAQNPNQTLGGNWAWPDARRYFYVALTGRNLDGTEVAKTTDDKNAYYAYTFRAVGQLMHLVEDASVPAHVRNDAHPEDSLGIGYESAIENFRTKRKFGTLWNDLLSNPISFDGAILNIPLTAPSAPVPIGRIVDTDKYDGDNPDITKTIYASPQAIGISEYANANFLSKDTMFESDDVHDFYYPRTTDTVAWIDNNNRTYIKKVGSGDVVNHLAITGWLYSYRQRYFPQYTKYLPGALDTECYKEYAQNLIPRAVGYSAGLLEYFFRGSIKISVPQSALYASTSDKDAGFTRFTLLAVNDTSDGDEMLDGTIELVARYRTVAQDPFQALDLQASNDYFYAVVPEATGKRTILRGTPVQLAFDLDQTTIIPLNAVDVSLQVVYHGKLGNEDGAVAVGWKSISDPTPVELVNNMDKICLYGNWYDAGSQAAVNQVGQGPDGIANWDIYPHDLQNIYLEVSPENSPAQASSSDYTFASAILTAGKPMQNYILSEYDAQPKYSYIATVVKTTPLDVFTHESDTFEDILPGYVVKSVVETSGDKAVCDSYGFSTPCAIRHAPPFYSFRARYLWGPMTTIFDNPKYPITTNCDWQQLQ
jgi:hypothetical protein